MEQLSPNLKYVAMALTEDWKSAHNIMMQATNDGASGSKNYGLDTHEPIQRVRWKKLVRLGVAAKHPVQKAFKRGAKWDDFKRNYGDEPTTEGCDYLDAVKLVDENF